LEEYSDTGNEDINQKYNQIKTIYEKFLEKINDKLIENIEQNIIYKFNMKEILDLNQNNNNQVFNIYTSL
jgi:hypothetical protein